jgi:hypothetical protein
LALSAALAAGLLRPEARAESADGRGAEPLTVVELFTSQGCSSCPPADALLRELSQEPGILALELHIDYWDYIGWEDPFAQSTFTERQRRYVDAFDRQYVYTPQMVIDGRRETVGSREAAVRAAIQAARRTPPIARPRFAGPNRARVVIPAGAAPAPATVWVAYFDARHTTEVARGENAGRRLVNTNVVRRLAKLGTWDGARRSFALDLRAARAAGRSHAAVIVQQGEIGPILGAAVRALDGVSG